jgi:hypothetical protein
MPLQADPSGSESVGEFARQRPSERGPLVYSPDEKERSPGTELLGRDPGAEVWKDFCVSGTQRVPPLSRTPQR